MSYIESLCQENNIKMTGQRRVIAKVLCDANDHPDVEEVYNRAVNIDAKISIATVYRTVRLFEESGIIEKHDFGQGRARYEMASDEHHDHIVDVKNDKIIEFFNAEIEEIQEKIAHELGYKIVDHKLELYCVPIED
jgi:Fur family ferric uptake transcriptional regulator